MGILDKIKEKIREVVDSLPDGIEPLNFGPGELIPTLNPIEMMNQGIKSLLLELCEDFLNFALQLLSKFVIWMTDFSRIPKFNETIDGLQVAAGILLGVLFLKRAFMGVWGLMTDEEEPNWAALIGRTVLSAFAIFATPKILTDYVVPVANGVSAWITSFGIEVNKIGGLLNIHIGGPGVSLGMIIVVTIYVVCLFGLTVAAAIRMVELGLAAVMGVVASVLLVDDSEIYRTYWREACAITFTQCIHIYLCFLSLAWAASGEFWKLILAIAALFVAYRGPQILRQYIYTSGAAQALGGAGRWAFYKLTSQRIKQTFKK